MTTTAWKPVEAGSWADTVELEEKQNGGKLPQNDFPSLGESAKTTSKPAKKKAQKLDLKTFLGNDDSQVTRNLPTSSRGRPDGEDKSASTLGGGFKDYGQDRERGGFRGRDRDQEERPPRDEYQSSRADEDHDWGSSRKFVPNEGKRSGGFSERNKTGLGESNWEEFEDKRGNREPRPPSMADQMDDWGKEKKFEPSSRGFDAERRNGPSGSFRDGNREGRPDFRSKADDEDQWGRGRAYDSSAEGVSGSSNRGRGFGAERSEQASEAERADKWTRPNAQPSESSEPVRTERPKIVLKPRSVGIAPATEEANEPASQRKSNPFGSARPREEILKEKGIDWIKEELKLEHGEVIRDETPEELELKKEIKDLKLKLEVLGTADGESDQLKSTKTEIDEKEVTLYKLQAELDDKVKYTKAVPLEPERGNMDRRPWERDQPREWGNGRDHRPNERDHRPNERDHRPNERDHRSNDRDHRSNDRMRPPPAAKGW